MRIWHTLLVFYLEIFRTMPMDNNDIRSDEPP